ncbi:tRNA modification GTPase MnmE [Oligella ureolytica]|uniref:tRNA modification GTPase MnmE n=1 Tax=Oligella ureolytica TaxID=90244 RepID=A0A378XG51_9BURK|nr:tRNA uridine-5-carboxymethylaminomethyl(34) synthesis GTPase MnmE [Oligella ureolytica]QPT38992.1 tRNA uridine-5-carboxymethylaminomethyl(34) synthesis GTPase MnmE [Oligella ureolytica]SUA54377.1 tRNA modification GTPase MnmE [Oligella ureolytica]
MSVIKFQDDPIVAIATAPGRGGIGVVRVSGKDLSSYINAFFGRDLTPRHAYYLPFCDAHGEVIDEGIALYFKGPNSYTGEDVLELQGHGGPAVLKRIIKRCIEISVGNQCLRPAEPGEFTQRAFLNGRLDLAQAEAVADLIDASSESAARSAMASLSGEFSKLVNELADSIIYLRMLVEATLDFPEEEIEFLEKYDAVPQLEALQEKLRHILQVSEQGMILREGLHVVLAGQPNVGKSSLLNALAGDEVAIVTAIAGTTRDRVVQQIHLNGVPLHIVDTAGLRETDDTVESIGIERSWAEIAKADVILHLQDAAAPDLEANQDILSKMPTKTPVITVFNKIDLLDEQTLAKLKNQNTADNRVFLSAKEQFGLQQLTELLLSIAGLQVQQETPWLARERHLIALKESMDHLNQAYNFAQQDDRVLDLFAEELRLSHEALNSITGEFTSDDLLGEIFSSFCIGK